MDYQKELERLQKGGNFWKPKVGQFKVKALTELEIADPFQRKREDGTIEENAQAMIKILVGDEEKVWKFGIGQTLASSYGQLVNLASVKENKLTGLEFTVIVKSDGTKNDYTLVV